MSAGLGKSIRAIRKMAGLTQDDLAQRIGLSRTSITNIELGRQAISETTINAIAQALGYEVRISFVRPSVPVRAHADVQANYE